MAHSELYAKYADNKVSEYCKQLLTRAHMFLIIDVLLFITHATFMSIDMTLGQTTTEDPSFLHMIIHILSLVLLVTCLFFHVHIHNTITAGHMNAPLHVKFTEILNAARTEGEDAAIKLAHKSMHEDMIAMEENAKKAMRYLDMIEYFTCAACCLLLLMPI